MFICSPIIPFNGLNYIGGVTSISVEDFTLALVGILPTLMLWVFLGTGANSLRENSNKSLNSSEGVQLYVVVLVSAGLAFCIVAVVLLGRFALKELKIEMLHNQAASWHSYHKQDDRPHSNTATALAEGSSEHYPSEGVMVPMGGDCSVQSSMHMEPPSQYFLHPTHLGGDDTGSVSSHVGTVASWQSPSVWAWIGVSNGLEHASQGPEDGRDEDSWWLIIK
jgi:hypothetical protein